MRPGYGGGRADGREQRKHGSLAGIRGARAGRAALARAGGLALGAGRGAGAIVYFVVVAGVVIPALSAGHPYRYQQLYSALGSTPGQMLRTMLTRPF